MKMTPLDMAVMALLIVGGLNWGLVGLFDLDVVSSVLGEGTVLTRAVFIIVGAAALWAGFTAVTRANKGA